MFPSNHQNTFILAYTGDCHGRNTTVRVHLYSALFRAQLDLVVADLLHVSLLSFHNAKYFCVNDHTCEKWSFLLTQYLFNLFQVWILISCLHHTNYYMLWNHNFVVLLSSLRGGKFTFSAFFYDAIWNQSYTFLNIKWDNLIPQHSRIIIGGGEVSWRVDSRHSTCLSIVSITLQPN